MKSNLIYNEAIGKHRRHRVFEIGDQVTVYVCKKRLPTGVQGKLRQRLYSPFQVLRKVNDNTYVTDLPDDMGIFKTLNVVDISPYHSEVPL